MAIVRETYANGGSGAATTSHAVTLPSGVAADDYVLSGLAFNGSPSTITLPSENGGGWTLLGSATGASNPRVYVYGKKMAGGETVATWGSSASIYSGFVSARYSGVDTTTPVDVTAVATDSGGATATTFDLTGVTTVTANAMVFAFASANSSAQRLTEDNILSLVVETFGTSIKDLMLVDGVQASAGATGTLNFDINSTLAWAGVVGALRPAISGGGTDEGISMVRRGLV